MTAFLNKIKHVTDLGYFLTFSKSGDCMIVKMVDKNSLIQAQVEVENKVTEFEMFEIINRLVNTIVKQLNQKEQ